MDASPRHTPVPPALPAITSEPTCPSGSYLAFRLAGEHYGLRVLQVQEIIPHPRITRLPSAPDFVRGALDLRGTPLAVVDLRVRLGLPQSSGEGTVLVVRRQLGSRFVATGLLVDHVDEVVAFASTGVSSPPPFGAAALAPGVVTAVGRTAKRTVLLLDVDRVLRGDDEAAAAQMAR